jgi:hypothetical protein
MAAKVMSLSGSQIPAIAGMTDVKGDSRVRPTIYRQAQPIVVTSRINGDYFGDMGNITV